MIIERKAQSTIEYIILYTALIVGIIAIGNCEFKWKMRRTYLLLQRGITNKTGELTDFYHNINR